jgi:hypothetical protein
MSMFEWDPRLDFEPSLFTKKLWLFLRKSPRIIGGVTLPGLFQTPHSSVDTGFFITALALEAWGLLNLSIVTEIQFAYMVLPFLIDLVLAFFRHLPQGSICEMSNRLVVAEKVEKDILQDKIKSRQRIVGVLSALIVLAALGKAYVFWSAQFGAFDALTAGILLSYLLAALIHIQCTGYFLFRVATSVSLWHNRGSYRRGKEPGASEDQKVTIGARAHSPELHPPFKLVEATAREQRLVRTGDAKTYWFETWGVLRDGELDALASAQRAEEQSAFVARAGLRHQLHILRVGPMARPADLDEQREPKPLADEHPKVPPAGGEPVEEAVGERTGKVVHMRHPERRRLRFAVFAGLVLSFGLAGCVQSGASREDVSFPLTILLTQALESDQVLPEDMLELLQPIWGTGCKALFYPDATLVRIDQDPAASVHMMRVDPPAVTESVQKTGSGAAKFFKFKPPAERKIRYVRELLEKHAPEPVLARAAATTSSERQRTALAGVLEKESGITIFVGADLDAGSEELVAEWKTHVRPGAQVSVASDSKEAAKRLAAYLCKAAGGDERRASAAMPRRALVVYRPSFSEEGVGDGGTHTPEPEPHTETTTTPPEHGDGHDEPAVTQSARRADAVLDGLRSRIASGHNLREIEHDLNQAALDFSTDYRFRYEHAKLVVFGRAEHHEAFRLLFNAGERAIRAGDQEEMLRRLQNDGGEGGPLHRLSRGHEEWDTLLDALQDRDEERLASTGYHH